MLQPIKRVPCLGLINNMIYYLIKFLTFNNVLTAACQLDEEAIKQSHSLLQNYGSDLKAASKVNK